MQGGFTSWQLKMYVLELCLPYLHTECFLPSTILSVFKISVGFHGCGVLWG